VLLLFCFQTSAERTRPRALVLAPTPKSSSAAQARIETEEEIRDGEGPSASTRGAYASRDLTSVTRWPTFRAGSRTRCQLPPYRPRDTSFPEAR
jgi:hypothetical protein